jgi:cytochrome c-type biogenesis protein CcmH/NrfG
LVYEPLLLAFASVLAPLGRIALAKTTIAPRLVALVALLAICAVAVALWGLFPDLNFPE